MKFAKYTFLIAGIYGLLALLPQYFLEEKKRARFSASYHASRILLRIRRRGSRLANRVFDNFAQSAEISPVDDSGDFGKSRIRYSRIDFLSPKQSFGSNVRRGND